VKFLGNLVTRFSGFYCCRVTPDKYKSPVQGYVGNPFVSRFIPTHANKTTGAVARQKPIALVLSTSGNSEISLPIVQRVVIAMVNALSIRYLHYLSMHVAWSVLLVSLSVKSFHSLLSISKPIPLIQPLVILRINKSVLALRKWNYLVGLVKRLRNFMSADMSFHGSTSDGIVMQPLFYHGAA
jgi:hypothetical protein